MVYHSNYLCFLERARTEWLRQLGFSQEQLCREQGLLFAVTRMEIRFLAPARLDDALTVSVVLQEHKRASLLLHQAICRDREQRQLVEAVVRIVALNSHFKPTRLPDALLHALWNPAHTGRHNP
ncbi:MAG: YbgC/FadM family acyl-CoA thioesterase [Magnetococcus sp. DMHC-8]